MRVNPINILAMSCKKKQEITIFIATVCILTYPPSLAVSLGKLDYDVGANKVQGSGWIRLDPQGNTQLPDIKVTIDQRQHKSKFPGSRKISPELTSVETEALLNKLEENGIKLKSLSWRSGNVSQHQGTATYKSGTGKGFQSDYTGVHTVQGEILGVSPDTAHLSEWLDMKPLVLCDQNVMTFTASGRGFTNLFVGRDGGVPISLFDLPSFCGYIVKTQFGGLEIIIPYDACYIIEENGNLVLPLQWWGSPLKLSCPMWRPSPAPTVYCLPYGMVVQIFGQGDVLATLGFKMKGRWGPLLTEECASLFHSEPEKFLFFIPTSAVCITAEFGDHLWLIIDELEYTLSCPVFPLVPASSPSEPQFPFYPDPVGPAPPSTAPRPPYLDPIFHHPDHPQIYPPALLSPKLPLPTADAPPRPPPQHHVQTLLPYFERGYMKPHPPSVTIPSPATPNFNIGQFFPRPEFPVSPDLSQKYNPYAPNFHAKYHPQPTISPPHIPNFEHFHHSSHFFQMPYHLTLPTTPPPTPPSIPLKPPGHFLLPPHTDTAYNPFHFFHQTPVNPPSPSLPPEPHKHCFPYGDKFCPYFPSPYYPYYHHPQSPVYPPVQKPSIGPPVPTRPPPQPVQHICLPDGLLVRLPFANPESIEVKFKTKVWIHLSDMPAFCGLEIRKTEGAGTVLQVSVPGCHTMSKSDSSSLLCLRYWDRSLAHSRMVEVKCPEQTFTFPYTPHPPVPTFPPVPTYPPVPLFTHESPKASCSAHHMAIEFPAGLFEISVKDLYGNMIKVQDVSNDCGYSVIKGSDGKIHLSIPLHFHCHMTLKGSLYTITIVYTSYHGTRSALFSCPAGVAPVDSQDCNLSVDKRLPCGPAHVSVSKSMCLSLGCCLGHHPPTCFYPMDECTADRHFVFSVPASLTDPPLSLPLLVAGGNSSCRPERVTSDSALFRVPLDGCGARRMQVGKSAIYLLEVNNIINSISLNYGTITRDSPIRLLVECRFVPGNSLTVSYMVKTPTLGPTIQTQGAFGVQLRIAKDSTYQSFYPQDHQPLQVLLGKPLYLEVRLLNSPDPSLVLLVHYCVAYPRSVKALWVLLYNGCPNTLDPDHNQVVVSNPKVPVPAQTRRFVFSTFKFLNDEIGKAKFMESMDSNEEIYIMCGTELCSPRDGPCVEYCFAQ